MKKCIICNKEYDEKTRPFSIANTCSDSCSCKLGAQHTERVKYFELLDNQSFKEDFYNGFKFFEKFNQFF